MTTINFGVQWHITDICNLRCKHCYREEQQKDLSLAENIKIFENFSRLPKKLGKKIDISLTGGEALLYPYIKELAEYLRSNEVVDELHLMTNGTIYSPEIVAFLHKYNIPAIQISIDGNQESHDFIRGKGNFAKSIENIKRFIENGITIQVHLVLNKNNIKDVFSLIKLLDSIHEIGFRALEYLSEAHTLREIAQLISGPNDSPSKIEQLMQPFWAMLQSKGIVEET